MKDVSFIIPLRVDCPERLNNLTIQLNYLLKNINAKIYVLEADDIQKGADLNRFDISYRFIKDDAPVFYFTRYHNEMIKACTTPYIAVCDVDVITPVPHLKKAVEKLRSKEAYVTWPYDGIFFNVPQELCSKFASTGDIETLTSCKRYLSSMYGAFSNGGIFLADREKYMEIGMENEHIYGWGPEDIERLRRMTILGVPVYRVKGEMYHLWHPRGNNRLNVDPARDMRNFSEYLKVCRMTREELLAYIKTWEWVNAVIV